MTACLLAVTVDRRDPPPKSEFWSMVHLDLITNGTLDDELSRLTELGARLVEVRQDPDSMQNPDTWAVLEDPEGNVFRVNSSATVSG